MVLINKKKHQKTENSDADMGEDKISNLPDELILHILSFLPTKCVISTCILSKKWNYVSKSTPILDFREWRPLKWWPLYCTEEERHLKTQRFMIFLDTVLYAREKPNVQKFGFSWDDCFDESRVNKWISIVTQHKLDKLFLSKGYGGVSFTFSPSMFTCDSSTVLDLDRIKINVPDTISFPKLKLLRLESMEYVHVTVNKLISNCPKLEVLRLIKCHGSTSEDLRIKHLALKKLYIDGCDFRWYTVRICAQRLRSISYGKFLPADFIFDNISSLVEAEIAFS